MRYLEEKVVKRVYLSKYCDKPNVINVNVYVLRMIYDTQVQLAPYSNKTVPYSFRKVFQAFQSNSRCKKTSSIRWYVRIFDIPKCIPIKPQILQFFYRKQEFPLLKPSHIRLGRCSKRSSPVAGVKGQTLSDGMFGFSIFQSVFQ